jgi:NAD(P)-dependent dehydrogenase (short-subunit alcohol dehydrogenase family)
MDFTGKRVIVTGAGKGIGRATAVMLARRGASVLALTRSPRDLETLEAEIGCTSIAVDLADADATRAAARKALPADLLVNCAGTTELEAFLDVSVENFDLLHAVNTRAPMIVAQEFAGTSFPAAARARSSTCRAAPPSSAFPTMRPIAPRRRGSMG